MTIRRPITWLAIASVFVAAPVHGQGGGAGLSLDEAIARAIAHQPSLRGARADIEVADGKRQQAALPPNPTFSFERRDEPAGTDDLTTIGIEWPLDLFRRRGRIATAVAELAVTGFAAADQVRMLAADVRSAYGLAAAAARELEVADELATTSRRHLELVRARVEQGATPRLDGDLLEVDLRRLEAERQLAAGRADVALVRLKQLLAMAPHESLAMSDTLESLLARSDNAPIEPAAESVAQRPDVREAQTRVTVAEARAEQSRREGRVDVSVFANYMRMDAGFPQLGLSANGTPERVHGQFNYIAAGATVVLPLFNRNQGQIAAALAERSGAEARRDAVSLAAQAEVAAAQARDTRAREAVRLYATNVLPLSRRNLDVVRQTFDLGRATVFDVLTEQRRYFEAEQAYTNALREAWDAHVDLKRAAGDTQ